MSRIRARREQAGITLTELAARAGIEISRLSRVERGIYKLTVEELMILALELGCEASELMPPVVRKTPAAS